MVALPLMAERSDIYVYTFCVYMCVCVCVCVWVSEVGMGIFISFPRDLETAETQSYKRLRPNLFRIVKIVLLAYPSLRDWQANICFPKSKQTDSRLKKREFSLERNVMQLVTWPVLYITLMSRRYGFVCHFYSVIVVVFYYYYYYYYYYYFSHYPNQLLPSFQELANSSPLLMTVITVTTRQVS